MPGLLDTVFGNPDQTAALGLLGAGLMAGNPAGAFGGASQYLAGSPDRALKQRLGQAQLDNYSSEIEARKLKTVQDQRQQQMIEGLFPGLLGGPPSGAPAGAPAMAGPPQMPAGAGPMPGGPSPSAMGGPPGAPSGEVSPVAQQGILALAQKLGIPPEAIKTDVIFNGGKGIADMIYKRGTPDMQVSNGFAYDKNRVGTGFMPGVNIANDGRGTMTLPGADGLPRMSTMPGSVEAYGSFEDRKNASASGQDLVKVVGADGAERYMTKAQAVAAAQPPRQPMPPVGAQPGMNGSFTGSPDQVSAAIDRIKDPQERANARAAFEEQARRTPGFGQGAPFQATQTTEQVNQAAANKEQAVQTAKDVADQRKSIMNAGFVAPSNIAKYQQIGTLLADVDGGKYTPAGTEVASALNGIGIKVDKNLPNKQAAASLANQVALELRNPANGGGMPGALSDSDRNFLASMTPNMAQSAQGRKMVIDSYIALQTRNQQVAQFARKYEAKHGRLDNGFFDQLQAWSSANPLFKGQ